jgi:DNA modification methylase
MELTQDRLDVLQKTRSNIFNWRGQFTPEFVEYIIEIVGLRTNSVIADPFVGSGTVLIEAAKKEHKAIGFEINPAAYQMSSFYKYSNLNLKERQNLLNTIELKLNSVLNQLNGQLIYNNSESYRDSYSELIQVAKKIELISNETDLSFLMNILFASEKDKKLTIKESLKKSFEWFKNILLNLPFNSSSIEIHNLDARLIGELYESKIDLIITSPPYINVFNYHQNYRAVTESFKYKILNVAHSEFGSNRKNRGNRLLTVVQYIMDMESSLKSFWLSLNDDGKMVMVLGKESNVRKTPFYNGLIITELINKMGGFSILSKSNRAFQNKFGKEIIEDILIIKKITEQIPKTGFAQNIAQEHLIEARKSAPDDVLNDFDDVMNKIKYVKHSPIYK